MQTIVELSLFEYDLSNGFNWTDREQEAISKLENTTFKAFSPQTI
ncbi:MAG: hypothetical protein ACK5EU_17900 [Pseudanabaena sp.]|jgi:hypothetical protein|nr:hypothetical protein [Pseudanabaena mucicola]